MVYWNLLRVVPAHRSSYCPPCFGRYMGRCHCFPRYFFEVSAFQGFYIIPGLVTSYGGLVACRVILGCCEGNINTHVSS